ncbi:Xaa-His dipeptidase [Clostridium botulinum]|uniref:Xaa-His dipeptidase n=1 Tax=Clostridium botulinum TaxID=1491 RepID=A0A6B4NAZ7_CLOBO|nr:hypothetical protein [Clostridium botulinum]EES49692.1 conserved hypothetical protein [Clostridium botulinum E1 str. 'BoNT E Beluga']MBY6760566.1 Xaa-His dipeptidase [Clostridium botulinum]MBY6919473.1 Xaa-His dipeptidase [Clostridium botulinum]MCR1130351.1 Xaa-His dipeptidase [Clostridium botulinum]NFJ56894.1 Xaa-His dipeptidase [Clostridium botulinum]
MKSVEDIIKDNLKSIESMAESGCTDKEIAGKLDISYSTFKRYKSSNKALKDLMAQCKDKKNEEVEQALFNNCIGYEYEEEVPVKIKEEVMAEDEQTVLIKERVVVKKVKKYCKPDLAAQKYWLNNMKKAKWSDDPNKVSNDKKLTKLKEKEAEQRNKLIEGVSL